MSNLRTVVLSQKRFAGFATLAVVIAVVFFNPTSRGQELLLLTMLGVVVVAGAVVIGLQHSARMARAMRLARRQHALFKAASEGSQQAFYLCKPVCDFSRRVVDFRITYVNAATEKLFGRSRHDLVGKQISAFLPRDRRLSVMAKWVRVAGTGIAEKTELPLAIAGADAMVYEVHIVALGGHIAISTLQSQEQQAAVTRVQVLNDFAEAILESAPVSMIATDVHGTITAMNSAAEQLTQYRKHELIGRHSLMLLHEPVEISTRAVQLSADFKKPVTAGFQSLIANTDNGRAEEQEWTYVRKDGSRVWVNLTMTKLLTLDQKIQGYLGIAFDITDRKLLTDSITHMAHHDQLTGLLNRTLLVKRLEEGLERSRHAGRKMAVYMVDIDNFKRINDSLGHAGGDELLMFLAKQLMDSVRSTDTVVRVGGDEFVVIVPDLRTVMGAEVCGAAMLERISTPTMIGSREVRVTASIGCCMYPDFAEDPSELLRRADCAMYEARSQACGALQIFSPALEKETADRLEMEEDLRHAVENGEIALHYQPQVRCATGEVTGMEMLMRWHSPKRGEVPPSVFIPAAEEAGLLVGIGEWAMRQACFDCVEAQRKLGTPLTVAVNLSPRQYSQRNLLALVREALDASGLPASQLEFEITEELLMMNTPMMIETLQQLRALGISVAIDDFGTGFSSFSYILEYNVDRLKIDKSFISRCLADPSAAAIVRTMLAMAHGLKIDVVAEGVETIDQMNFLLRRKCDVAQGFLFSKAVALKDFVKTVERINNWVLMQQETAQEVVFSHKADLQESAA